MDYIYGELNEKVIAIKYSGGETDSAEVTVNNSTATITADVKDDYIREVATGSLNLPKVDLPSGKVLSYIKLTDGVVGVDTRDLSGGDFPASDVFTEAQVTNLPTDLHNVNKRVETLDTTWNYSQGKIINSIDIDTTLYNKSIVTITDRLLVEEDVQGLPEDIERVDKRISDLDHTWQYSQGQIIDKIDIDTSNSGQSQVTINSRQLVQEDVDGLVTRLSTDEANLAQEIVDRTADVNQERSDRQAAINALDFEKLTFGNGKILNTIEQVDGKINVTARDVVRADYIDDFFSIDQVENLREELDQKGGSIAQEKAERIAADNELHARIDDLNLEEVTAGQFERIVSIKEEKGKVTVTKGDMLQSNVTNLPEDLTTIRTSISTEVSDRQTAISAEKSERETEDSAINTRIDNLILNEYTFETGKILSTIKQDKGLVTLTERQLQLEDVNNLPTDLNTIRTSISTEKLERETADNTLLTNINTEAETRSTSDSTLQSNINAEANTRETKDTNLQQQIDVLESKTDVVDVVGTKLELLNYDTSKLHENDIVKVLKDESKNDAITYYRWKSSTWNYVGESGPFYTKAETDTLIATAKTAVETELTTHKDDKNNPHEVTKTQVGLSNVDNTSDIDKPISTAQQFALDLKSDKTELQQHISNNNNPHSVTKTQVGLENVDNTSDADKPISTALQSALDLKANSSDIGNGQLTIKQNGVLAGTFTANQSGDVTVDLDVTAGQAQADWNLTDATAASYIKNKPTIGAGSITIKLNDISIGSFNVNQTTDAEINIQATVQQQADWNQTDTTAVDYIKNKPSNVVTKDWFIITE